LRLIRFLPYLLSYELWCLLRPVKRGRVLFLSDSHLGFVGNMAFLRDAMERRFPDVEFRGLFKKSLATRRSLRDAVRLPYLMATSSIIILDDFYPVIYPMRIRTGVRVVQLWHAAGAFKRVGHSRAGLPGGPTTGSEIHRNYTDAVVSSAQIVDDYAEAFALPRERVHAWGMPRSDAFFDAARVSATRSRVRRDLGVADDERLVVYAPTFRGKGQTSAYGAPETGWDDIAEQLGAGWRVAVRPHPFVAQRSLPRGVMDASAIPEMNDLLMATDILVTDYSSAIFEFALLQRPMVFFVPDLVEYSESRSFYRPFDHYAVGPVVEHAAELASAIRSAAVDRVRLDAFVNEFCGALDGASSDRIAGQLLGGVGYP